MSGDPRDATIWTRDRRYFLTSRSQRTYTTFMRLSPPYSGYLPHLVGGSGTLVANRRASELEEGSFERIGARLLLELGRRARGHDPAVVDHGDAVRDAVGFVHVMRREKHRDPLGLVEVADEGPHLIAALRIEAERRLVEKQHLRGVQQPAGDLEPPLHPARERLHEIPAPLPQLEHREQGLRPFPPDLARHVIQDAVDVHVFPRRQVAVETGVLKHDTEPPPHVRLMLRGIEPVELQRSARRVEQGREHLDRGGLPGAVGTEKREDLAGFDVEGDVVDRRDFSERLDDVLDTNDRM